MATNNPENLVAYRFPEHLRERLERTREAVIAQRGDKLTKSEWVRELLDLALDAVEGTIN